MNNLKARPGVGFIGRFKNGILDGPFWVGMPGNGFLHGIVNDKGELTGDDIAYIYPDGVTAFKGRFENRYMISARNVDIKKYTCDENGMLIASEFTEPLTEHIFKYDPCTNVSFGGGGLPNSVRDPYEEKMVKLGPSSIPNSGEGVVAIQDIPAWQFATIYSTFLYRYPDQYELYKKSCTFNISKSDDYRRGCKKYSLGIGSYHAFFDLPPEYDVNPLPNLGGKVNHHFYKNNTVFMEMEHPRYGLIQSLTPTRDIKAGEELFAYYGYASKEFPSDFPWYYEAKIVAEKELRLIKEQKKEEEKLKQKSKKVKKSKKNKAKP